MVTLATTAGADRQCQRADSFISPLGRKLPSNEGLALLPQALLGVELIKSPLDPCA
jgi:hypothetical protein